jgi:long-chain acyl-CoA synthetase
MQPAIGWLPHAAARKFGAEVAVAVVGGRSLTFREIDAYAARVAGGLVARGMTRGARLVLHVPNGWQWIVAYYAVARLGGVVVPANILLTPAEVAYMAADSSAVFVLTTSERCEPIRNELASLPHEVRGFVSQGTSEDGAEIRFAELMGSAPLDPVTTHPDELFTIGYTSGTTGKPKGAMLTHRCVFMSTALSATCHVRARGETVVTALPLPHVYGNVVMNAAFLTGMRLVLLERFDAELALRTLATEHATMFEGVPTMYYYLLAHADIGSTDLSSLRRCTVGGQTMPVAKLDEVVHALGCPLLELWGMTEVAGPATSHSPYLPPRHGSIGLPFTSMAAKIVDVTDPSRTLANGEPGELLVRGPLVMRGYWRNDAATKETLQPSGWLHTGDIAHQDDDGYLFIVDRKKDLIITAGYNVYPAELEQVIAQHTAVAMVAVAGVPDAVKGELAHAFVVLRQGATVSEEDLLQHCRSRLAAYKVPRQITFVADLPKTSTGKLLRRALREQARSAPHV